MQNQIFWAVSAAMEPRLDFSEKPDLTSTKGNNISAEGSFSSSTPNQDADQSPIREIPDELVWEILARLPAKALARFKCVSKSWLYSISSKRFIKTHVALVSGRDDYSHHVLVLSSQNSDYFDEYSVTSVLLGPIAETQNPGKLGDNHQFKCPVFVVVGSCNGLICVYNFPKKELGLWNPFTKDFKKLPRSGMEKWRCWGTFGFGYDEVEDDYKVVGLFKIFESAPPVTKIRVYSLKNNSWRAKDDLDIIIPWPSLDMSVEHARGKLCWQVNRRIGGFDLADETYDEMDLPIPPNNWDLYSTGIRVLGDCFSAFYDRERTHMDIWVLKEYGVQESWTKLVSIPYVDGAYYKDPRPICLLRNGEILIVLTSEMLLYNPKRKTFRRFPGICNVEKAFMYVESFVSPNAYSMESDNLIRKDMSIPR